MEKWADNKAWFLVLPVFVIVAFSAIILVLFAMPDGLFGRAVPGDIDGDGDLDLVLTSVSGQDRLCRNDGDGVFDSSREQIAGAVDVVEGDNMLEFDVPSWAASGNTYARFRLTTDSIGSNPGGEASDGEVEDYAVDILHTKWVQPPEATTQAATGIRMLSMRPASIGPVKSILLRSDLSAVHRIIADARHRGDQSVRPAVMEWLRAQG